MPLGSRSGLILFAIVKVRERGVSSCYILSNTLKVTEAIKGVEDWSIGTFILDILESMSHFGCLQISYVPRCLNEAANRVAKFWQKCNKSYVWPGSFPLWLSEIAFVL